MCIRDSSGKVQSAQRDSGLSGGDRLTLSAPGSNDTDPIVLQRQAEQTAQRAAELNRNIQELNRLVQSGDTTTLTSPLPQPLTSPKSELIAELSQNPQTAWAALALVLTLAGWVLWRAQQRQNQATPLTTEPGMGLGQPLQVDFDLSLPSAESLPPLPDSVHQKPTAVHRVITPTSSSPADPNFRPVNPMAGISLDLPGAETGLSANERFELRWDLVQALWDRGLTQTARVLARELQDQATPEWSQRAQQWLDERA